MSDILIRGMEMPKYLGTNLTIYPDGRVCKFENGEEVVAEATEVPTHGRLIDADVLYRKCGSFSHDDLRIAKTVIPASEEVYASGYDTAGNYHWVGTKSGEHIIPAEPPKEET